MCKSECNENGKRKEKRLKGSGITIRSWFILYTYYLSIIRYKFLQIDFLTKSINCLLLLEFSRVYFLMIYPLHNNLCMQISLIYYDRYNKNCVIAYRKKRKHKKERTYFLKEYTFILLQSVIIACIVSLPAI